MQQPSSRRFQQRQGANHIGLHKRRRPIDRTVDMAFCGEVDDRVRLVLAQQSVQQDAIRDAAFDEDVRGVAQHAGQRVAIASIGERIQIKHLIIRVFIDE